MNMAVVFLEIYNVDTGSLCMFPSFSAKSFTRIINITVPNCKDRENMFNFFSRFQIHCNGKDSCMLQKLYFRHLLLILKCFSTFSLNIWCPFPENVCLHSESMFGNSGQCNLPSLCFHAFSLLKDIIEERHLSS